MVSYTTPDSLPKYSMADPPRGAEQEAALADAVQAAFLSRFPAGVFTSYTPNIGGGGWSIGNGTVAGAYRRIDRLVLFRFRVVFGSTSTFGGAQLTVDLPFTSTSSAHVVDSVNAIDTSASQRYKLHGHILASDTVVNVFTLGTGGALGAVTTGSPFAWASSDQIFGCGWFEAAS